jgi:dTDP-glucose 4,6-dehydratase
VTIVRGTNAYGPRQNPEKAIPVFVTAALDGRPLPVYDAGRQRREWLYVTDWIRACLVVLDRGEPGGTYNIGSGTELANLELAQRICALAGADPATIAFVDARPGHDFRYGLDDARLRALGWTPEVPFDEGLARTVAWYRDHRAWVETMLAGVAG